MDKSKEIYDSASIPSPFLDELIGLVRFRRLAAGLIYSDFATRYKRSVLGVLWTFLHPLGIMLVMYFIFSNILGRIPGFHIYLLSGLIPWMFFSEATSEMGKKIIWGGQLLKRIYMPMSVLVIASAGVHFINMCLMMIPLILLATLSGYTPNITYIALPAAMVLVAVFATGLGLVMTTVTSFFTDGVQIYMVVLRAWFYLTPIFWHPSMIKSETVLRVLSLNPLSDYLGLFRAAIYEGVWPDPALYIRGGAIALIALLIGWTVFAKNVEKLRYRI